MELRSLTSLRLSDVFLQGAGGGETGVSEHQGGGEDKALLVAWGVKASRYTAWGSSLSYPPPLKLSGPLPLPLQLGAWKELWSRDQEPWVWVPPLPLTPF